MADPGSADARRIAAPAACARRAWTLAVALAICARRAATAVASRSSPAIAAISAVIVAAFSPARPRSQRKLRTGKRKKIGSGPT